MLQYILVSLIVVAAVVYIVIQLFFNKKKKGAACGQCGCEGCPLMDKCTEKGH